MIDTKSQLAIQELFRREHRCFLQYVYESSPWVSPQDQAIFDRLKLFAKTELTELSHVAEFMHHHRITLPHLGAYPTKFTSYNFANIRKLLPVLREEQNRDIQLLEKDRDHLTGEARVRIDKLIETKRRHLHEMESLGKE